MKHNIIHMAVSFFYALFLIGCVGDELSPDLKPDREVKLVGYVPSPIVATKAADTDYIYDYFEPTGELEFSFIRWDQGNATSDPSDNSYVDNVLSAKLGDPVPSDSWKRYVDFETIQYFPADNSAECGFAGCYPPVTDENWVRTDGRFISGDRKMTYDIDGRTDVMVSDFKKGSYNTGIDPITFKHALCLYKIYAYAVDQDSKDEWGKIDAVTFINLPEQLFVTLPEDMTAENATVEFSYTPKKVNTSEYVKQHIICDPSLDANSDGIIDVFDAEDYPVGNRNGEGLSMPAGYTSNNLLYVGSILGGAPEDVLGINVSMDNPEIIAESAVSIARDFQPGYTYNIILRFSTHGIINASVTVEDWPDEPIVIPEDENSPMIQQVFTNLSRYGTANSYVVSSANMGYAFDCTVKGNGVNSLADWQGNIHLLQDTDASINPAMISSIKVIWSDVVLKRDGENWIQTNDNEHDTELIHLVSDTPVDGKILFEVKGNDNDHEDFSLQYRGNALIGAYNATGNLIWSWHIWVTDKPINLDYGNGYISQDRNLGAVSSEPAFYSKNHISVSGMCYQWGRKDPLNPDYCGTPGHNHSYAVTTAEGSSVPIMKTHQNPTTFYTSTTGNWCSDAKDYQWGYVTDQDDIVKTLYDPCPPGYRVNGNSLWELQSDENVELPYEAEPEGSGWIFDIGEHTEVYYTTTTYFNENGEIVDSRNVDDPKVYQYSANPGYLFTYPPQTPGNTLSQVPYRTGAFPVRCVMESSKKAVTDLSREQTANCYIIENPGYYKFNAKVPGNAVGSLSVQNNDGGFSTVQIDGGVGTTLPNVAKVDVLWWQGDLTAETAGGDFLQFAKGNPDDGEINEKCPIKILDYNPALDNTNLDEEGYAYMKIDKGTFAAGNVILAGYNTSGDILWTWHMWLLPEGLDVVRLGQYSVLDRNLGATYAPTSALTSTEKVLATYGFYYQWGRKDPFVPPGRYNPEETPNDTAPWFYKNSDGSWTKKESLDKGTSTGSIANSIANPTQFVAVSGSWQDTYPISNTSGPVNQLWGYTGLTGTASFSSAKTMWDPCPPGYKMIDHTVLGSGNLWDENGSNNSIRYITNITNNSYGLFLTTANELGWNKIFSFYLNTGKADTDGLWLPFSRAITAEGSYNLGVSDSREAWMHTSCPFNGATSRSLSYNYQALNHRTNMQHAIGRTVRCLKE